MFIRKLVVGCLLLLFAFSITPVALLHDAITSHKDICYHNFQERGKTISKTDINCHCLSFVADEHFISSLYPFHPYQLSSFIATKNQFYLSHFYSQHHFFAELRGPPVLI